MSQYVPGIGPSNAKLMIIGEAPGGEEERQGLPFVGATGKMVDDLLTDNCYSRAKTYLTNVVKVRPPDNDIKKLKFIGTSIEHFLPQLWEEIRNINPNCILALGNTALEALTGYRGIEKYRGSILQATQHTCKVVGSIHPASLLHKESDGKMKSWKDLVFIRWDVARAIAQSKFRELELPRRNLMVCKSYTHFREFMRINEGAKYCSEDIETFRTIPICIALAFNSYEAMSIPLFGGGITRTDLCLIWQELAEFQANPRVLKIGQNFKFDQSLLESCVDRTVNFGLRTRGFFFDTMLAFKTLYPELNGSLQFITSVLTEEPYYKDEGKEYNPKKDKLDRLLLYNAKDAVVTYEIFEKELCELREFKIENFFFERVMSLHSFYSRLEGRGIKRDNFAHHFLDEKYKIREQELTEELKAITGEYDINPNSPKQVGNYLYGVLGIPHRKDVGEDTLLALLSNTVKKEQPREVIKKILELRKVHKTRGTYINANIFSDGKLRTGCRIMLETGRTATSVLKPPVTTHTMGLAFQTITKHGDVGTDLRSMFVPDDGYVFLEPDLAQAESRVVAILGRDKVMLKAFADGIDIHRLTASWIFGKEPDEIEGWERQLGKTFRHAGEGGMGKHRAAQLTGLSEWRCGQLLSKFHDSNPSIEGTFMREIREFLEKNDRVLINPFGRRRQFFNRWGEELFKEAYRQIPQSTVSDQLKFAAQRIERRLGYNDFHILQESHDSFLSQVKIALVDKAVEVIREELEQPIDFSSCSLPRGQLTIPCEIKIGKKNWEQMEKIA